MIETHPFGVFVPTGARYLILGSFPGRDAKPVNNASYWYYGSKRNQFWSILELTYAVDLTTVEQRKALFSNLKIAVTDIIYQCERENGSNLDNNLINIVYNLVPIEKLLASNKIEATYFTSRFVEKRFRQHFSTLVNDNPRMQLITLPSPSPRFASLTKQDKSSRYKLLLPTMPS
jgi:hypoxanthine-DNA glycosylase